MSTPIPLLTAPALTPPDFTRLQVALVDSGTMPSEGEVRYVVVWHEFMGRSADEIAAEYGLTLSDVYAALAYYYDHPAEINESIEADEAFVEELRKTTRSKLPGKAHGR